MLVDELPTHVEQRLRSFGVSAESRLLCAVSGGVDSVTLLDILAALAPQMGFALGIAHADHGLRGEASRHEAAFVRHIAEQQGLPIIVEELPVRDFARQRRCSIETAARHLRYDFFRRAAQSFRATHVVLAHTADDNAETVLLHLLRGAGLEGLAGIPPQRELFPGCSVIRPLLEVRKQTLLAYARARGLQWCEDESNRDRRFRRNRVRWELLPLAEQIVPGAVSNVARCSAIVRRATDGIEQLLDPLLRQAALPDGTGFFFSDAHWDSLPAFFQAELLRLAVRRLGCPYSPPARRLAAALALRTAQTGKRTNLTQTLLLFREHNGLSLVPVSEPFPTVAVAPAGSYRVRGWELSFQPISAADVCLGADPWTEFMDAERLPPTLHWRAPLPGDRFHPLGMPRPMKLGDFLTKQRIPHWRRHLLSVLADEHRVLWLCGIRLSQEVALSPTTRQIVRVQLRRVSPTPPSDDSSGD